MKKIVALISTLFSLHLCASLGPVVVHGVATGKYQDKTYFSIKDSLNREYNIPKNFLKNSEKVINRQGMFLAEVDAEKYQRSHFDCLKAFENKRNKSEAKKRCLPSL